MEVKHVTRNINKKNKLINLVKDYYSNYGYKTIIRFNGDPDEDFVYMSNSKHFVKGGGGFSCIINELVNLRGNNSITYITQKDVCK